MTARPVVFAPLRGDDRPVPPTFRFELPGALREVGLVVELRTATEPRQHVLLMEIERPVGVSLDDSGLSWSDRLGARFQYVPAVTAPGTVRTDAFAVPGEARSLRIRVYSWREDPAPVVTEIRLSTDVDGHSVLVLPEEA